MWQSGGIGGHAQNNPWMKLMGIVHKRHHDSGGGTQTSTTGSNDRTLNQWVPQINFTFVISIQMQ